MNEYQDISMFYPKDFIDGTRKVQILDANSPSSSTQQPPPNAPQNPFEALLQNGGAQNLLSSLMGGGMGTQNGGGLNPETIMSLLMKMQNQTPVSKPDKKDDEIKDFKVIKHLII